MKSGEDYECGSSELKSTNTEAQPVVLELKEGEYINNIFGVGTDYIKSMTIETNFYRKIKLGSRLKDENTPKADQVIGFS